jgi:D-alanyl-D-alanine carboxypeptidase/D-alanyl-D-alanine-endopeptidase (penicillin-binding protein 4)
MRTARLLLATSLATAACRVSSAPAPSISYGSRAELRTYIDSMADAPEFANAHLGILIVDPERGDTLYSRNAGKLFMPASNMKIPTSAVALTQLGPDYRFKTRFGAQGSISNGTLDGDLLVIGAGDPSVSDHMLTDAMIPLRLVADSLYARGIRRITGRVVPWGNAFPGDVFGYGWTYADFEDSYSAPIDELLFNEGFSEVHVRGGARSGDPAEIRVSPARTFPRIRNSAVTLEVAPGDSSLRRGRGLRVRKDSTTWDIIIEGRIAARDTTTIEVTHHDPDEAYVAALREALTERGIVVDGGAGRAGDEVVQDLVTLSSPPLSEILKAFLKPSQNQIGEMLFRAISLHQYKSGRPDSAAVAVNAQLAQWGVNPSEALIRDGSGLSRYDYLAPRTIVRILDAMRKSPNFRVYYDAMPIAGVDGTIRSRMRGTPAANNVHAKTGTVAQSRSLSGYVTTADNHMLIFSFLSNNFTVPTRRIELMQDSVSARLAGMRLR